MRTVAHSKPLGVVWIVEVVSVYECTDGIQIARAILQVFVQEGELVCSQDGVEKVGVLFFLP